jgi:hypothetical protein
MKLQKVIDKFKGLGYKDFVITQEKGNIIMKFENQKTLSEGTRIDLIRELHVQIEQTDNLLTIII